MRELIVNSEVLGELASEVVGQGGGFCFGAHGRSMLPFVRDGARLTIVGADSTLLRVGDIIVYRAGNRLLAHRIVRVDWSEAHPRLYARGDASSGLPEEVHPEQVLGLVVQVTHGTRTIDPRSTLRRAMGLAWIAATPVGQALLGLAVFAWSAVRRLGGVLSINTKVRDEP